MDTEYQVQEIKIAKILSDSDFNCRGTILPMDVIDLVKDIDQHGLQFPIAVQPITDVDKDVSRDYDFRIIAGHRRFAAFRVLKRTTIPAMIKSGLSEIDARLLNLGENLKRENLNLLQEARAIERLRLLGLNRRQTGEVLGVSTSWVQVRYNLLDLPDEIQEEAAAGLLNQQQIKQIYGLRDKTRQYDAVKKIKNARLRGEQGISVAKTAAQDPFKKKRQQKNSVQDMIEHMSNSVGYGLHTRALAWANGEISSAELFFDIKRYAEEKSIVYKVPIPGVTDET